MGELLLISNNDLRAFDVIGYDFVTVSEPSTFVFSALGLTGPGLFALRRRCRA